MSGVLRVPSDGAPQARASGICSHLPASGEQETSEISVPPYEDVLLQTNGARPVPLCFFGKPIRLQAQRSEGAMAVSPLSDKLDTSGNTAFSTKCQRVFATRLRQCKKGIISQLGTLPVPLCCRSQWDCFHMTFFRLLYLHLSQVNTVMYTFTKEDQDIVQVMIPCCLAFLNFFY